MTGPQSYTVQQVVSNEERPDKGNGPMRSIRMTFAGSPEIVEWYTRGTTQPPEPGAQLIGTVEDSQYGKKFKKAQQQGSFGGGPRPEDPKRAARILRQHSQDMAISWATLAHVRGKLPEDFTIDSLKPLIDWFDRDAEAAAQ